MADLDKDFGEVRPDLMEAFENEYADRCTVIEKSMIHIRDNILPGVLEKAEILVQGQIASRMKEKKSAIETINRRWKKRMKREAYKEDLERHNVKWETYWRKDHPWLKEYGTFADVNHMFNSLHDIGGIRILIYFPKDVDKIERLLEAHDGIELVKRITRGQDVAKDDSNLESFLMRLNGQEAQEGTKPKKFFPGYSADHFHVRPRNTGDDALNSLVEIQVVTVVMSAWSQVEHDIVYKGPKEPGPEKRAILDTLNGIVMIGENALRQLHDTIERKEIQRREKSKEEAAYIFDIGKWIGEYWANHKKDQLEYRATWRFLERLFQFLKARSEHTSGTVRDLVVGLIERKPDVKFDRNLPIFLLQQCWYRQTAERIPLRPDLTDIASADISQKLARMNAIRVIHCFHIAAAFDIRKKWIDAVEMILPPEHKRPTLLELMDLLHPTQSRCNDDSLRRISLFCESFLNLENLSKSIENEDLLDPVEKVLMELPHIIVRSGRVAHPTFLASSTDCDATPVGEIVIPRVLCVMVRDSQYTHWIPDLYHVARHWKNSNKDKRVLSPTTLTRQAHRDIQNMRLRSGVNPVDALGHNIIEVIDDTVQELRKWDLFIPFDEPHYRWVWRRSQQGGTLEFHTDKEAKAPRKHRGYFVSVDDVSGDGRRWNYITEDLAWELQSCKDPFLGMMSESEISRRDKGEFEDFFNNLLPSHLPIDWKGKRGDHDVWEMQLGSNQFSITSTTNEYILSEKSGEVNGLPLHVHTQRDSSTQTEPPVEQPKGGSERQPEEDIEQEHGKKKVQTLSDHIASGEARQNVLRQPGDVREEPLADLHNGSGPHATSEVVIRDQRQTREEHLTRRSSC